MKKGTNVQIIRVDSRDAHEWDAKLVGRTGVITDYNKSYYPNTHSCGILLKPENEKRYFHAVELRELPGKLTEQNTGNIKEQL